MERCNEVVVMLERGFEYGFEKGMKRGDERMKRRIPGPNVLFIYLDDVSFNFNLISPSDMGRKDR